jgi:hypothetical protein
MIMTATQQIAGQVEIRGSEAVWVLGAHLYATLLPLILCVVVDHHWAYLSVRAHDPLLFYIAVGLLCIGSAFEVAQNTIDRWYLTPETASANGAGFCDFLFYWFVTAGQAVVAIAIDGGAVWVWSGATAAVLIFPLLYLKQVAIFAPMGVTGIMIAVVAYRTFGDPVIFLQLLLPVVTLYFFGLLLKTGAQVMHGFTTAAASSGIWFLVLAIHNGETSTPWSWTTVIVTVAATVLLGAALRPVLARLPASPRVVRRTG